MPRTVSWRCQHEGCEREFNVPTFNIYLTWLANWPFRFHCLMHFLQGWLVERRRKRKRRKRPTHL